MSLGKKLFLWLVLLLLCYGVSAPWQGTGGDIFLGFLPAPMFYLILVHIAFCAFIGYLAFLTRMHGRVEDDERFLAELAAQKKEAGQ